jgi:hypothetical protein
MVREILVATKGSKQPNVRYWALTVNDAGYASIVAHLTNGAQNCWSVGQIPYVVRRWNKKFNFKLSPAKVKRYAEGGVWPK